MGHLRQTRLGAVARLVRPNILVVDSDVRSAHSLADSLRHDFAEVVVVSPADALAVALEHEFAVVLAVQRGPGLGGMKLLARVRRRWGRSRGFLVAGYADAETLAEAIGQQDSSEYLFMPWDEQELVRVLRDAARQYLVRRAQASARDQVVAALRSSERLYRSLVEHAPDGVLLIDRHGRCVEANPAVCELLGYARSELLGVDAASLGLGTLTLAAEGAAGEVIRAHSSHLLNQAGQPVPADLSARALPDGSVCFAVRPTGD